MFKTPLAKQKTNRTLYSPAPNLKLLTSLVGEGGETETPLKAKLSRVTTAQHNPKPQQYRSETVIICVQHILETTASLFNAFLKLGLDPNNIYLMGKCYSTCKHTQGKIKENLNIKEVNDSPLPKRLGEFAPTIEVAIRQLFAKIIQNIQTMLNKPKKIILLDEGAKLLIPDLLAILKEYPIFAVEQTTAGHRKYKAYTDTDSDLPWISVARSDLKLKQESPLIAEAITARVQQSLQGKQKLRCGVIGLGAIGEQVAKKLTELGHEVSFYDPEIYNANYGCYNIAAELIKNSEYIFGCTGLDTLHEVDLAQVVNGEKHFISCSSEDIEFNTFLRYIQGLIDRHEFDFRGTALDDINLTLNNQPVTIHRGGFPINFDGGRHSVAPEKIAVTRAALLTAVYQWLCVAPKYAYTHKGLVELDKEAQQYIVKNWKQLLAEDIMGDDKSPCVQLC